jgi:hypothetical protein
MVNIMLKVLVKIIVNYQIIVNKDGFGMLSLILSQRHSKQ